PVAVVPLEPFAEAFCRTGRRMALAECSQETLPARLALTGRAARIENLLRRASASGGRRHLLPKVKHVLSVLRARNARFLHRGRIGSLCAGSLERRIAALETLLASLRAS